MHAVRFFLLFNPRHSASARVNRCLRVSFFVRWVGGGPRFPEPVKDAETGSANDGVEANGSWHALL